MPPGGIKQIWTFSLQCGKDTHGTAIQWNQRPIKPKWTKCK